MAVYYNEIDSFAAAWLRELMKAGQIPDGEIDTRSIELVHPDDLRGFHQCHFFAGIGGWAYALRLAKWGDRPVWTGSAPCQPFSSAGAQVGGDDPRHLWPTWFRLIRECRPDVVFGEQVEAAIGHGWLDLVFDDLEREGYATGAVSLASPCVGAFDIRQRLWFVADTNGRDAIDGSLQRGGQHGLRAEDRRADGGEGISERTEGELADTQRGTTERHGFALAGAASGAQGAAQERERLRDDARDGGNAGELGDTNEPRSQGRQLHGERAGECVARPAGLAGFWADADWIPCADGKARPVPSVESSFLALADGFWYRMADVRAAFAAEGAEAVRNYAATTGSRPEEAVSLVSETIRAKTVVRWPITGSHDVSQTEVLLSFLRDVASTLNRSADGCGGEETSTEADRWMLRDLRLVVAAECASLRREPKEQPSEQPSDALLELSWFLARCCEACGRLAGRSDAAYFPLAGKTVGRAGILRGAGNAIKPQVAQVFIEAYLEVNP